MTLLTPDQFSDYFAAVHGRQPFPWQKRLLRQVLADGWPKVISLPTASGKTAVLDVAVFALACSRDMPRRMALVVDRRIVVDDAFSRARLIREKLMEGRDDILRRVATSLLALGGDEPLAIAELRGGIYREDRWARNPAQPVILCSTVDQVGSRLLHRGYGVSSGMWPVHAGLLGNDTLIVLDEAHCSRPFAETLDSVSRFRQVATHPLNTSFAVVTMTATPHGTTTPFRLEQADRDDRTLNRRLTARKLAALHIAEKPKDAGLSETLVTHAEAEAKTGRTVLVTVNRVATARAVAERLKKRIEDKKEPFAADVILLTGRVRAVERDALLESWRWRLMAGRDRHGAATEKPLIVVATQCIEVGADLDVDALITECCPLDSLRQRLGRLDRLGERGETSAVIVCRGEHSWDGSKEPPDDPVYGMALARTWFWLTQALGEKQTIDLGTDALDEHLALTSPKELEALIAPAPHAPVIFPAYCDLWAQTGPEPSNSPDPSLFLHGPARGEPEVRFVWRGDLGDDPRTWADTVAFCPPVVGEGVAVRLSEARRWLALEGGDPDAADIEGQLTTMANDRKAKHEPVFRPALRWCGPEQSSLTQQAGALRPGDTMVIPAKYGGCDDWGWNPATNDHIVTDLADIARVLTRRAPVLRLHPAVLPLGVSAGLAALATLSVEELPDDLDAQVRQALAAETNFGGRRLPVQRPARRGLIDPAPVPEASHWHQLVSALATEQRLLINLHPSGVGLIVSGRRWLADTAADFTDEDNTSSAARLPVGL